jgi:hypothetical protein
VDFHLAQEGGVHVVVCDVLAVGFVFLNQQVFVVVVQGVALGDPGAEVMDLHVGGQFDIYLCVTEGKSEGRNPRSERRPKSETRRAEEFNREIRGIRELEQRPDI